MRQYAYNYQTRVCFDSLVTRHAFLVRCAPAAHSSQHIVYEKLYLHPFDSLTRGADALGNRLSYGHVTRPHDSFMYISEGIVRQEPYRVVEELNPVYRYPSRLAPLAGAMAALADDLGPIAATDNREQAACLAGRVHDYMRYTPGATGISTTGAEAFALGQGVCQDYAHILIALCRHVGIPARYANGFIPGIGQTHAWVEVYHEGAWFGIDPTNNQRIEYGYIKVAHGRDAADCPMNRGLFTGDANQRVEILAEVNEL